MKPKFTICGVFALVLLLTACEHYKPVPVAPDKTADAFDARSLSNPELKAFLEKNLGRPVSEWPLRTWDFDTLLLAALYYHPSLEVARTEWQATSAGKITAAQRPNPTVSAVPGYSFNAPEGTPSPWFPSVTFDVPFETAGKRTYRKERAEHLSEAARLKIASAAWQVRSNLRIALFDYSAASQRAKLLRQQIELQEKIVSQLQARFQAGAISSFEVATARIALARTQAELDDLNRQMAEAAARVATAIGVPASDLKNVALAPKWELAAESQLTSPELRRKALLGRPDILSALADYAASQSALQLEIARQYPDIHWGSGYQYDEGEHKWSLSLGVELPILNQNQGPIAEAKAARASSAAKFEALQGSVLGEIDRATADYRGTLAHLKTLDDLIAAQEKQRSAVQAQLQAGAADQLELLNAQIELLTTQLLKFDGSLKAVQAMGQLEEAVQQPFPALSAIERNPILTQKDTR